MIQARNIGFTATTDSNGWTEMDCGSFKIYIKNGTRSVTVNGNSWKASTFSEKPTNLVLSHAWSGSACAVCDDNAITLNGKFNTDNGQTIFTQVNHFSSNITATTRYNLVVIEFV